MTTIMFTEIMLALAIITTPMFVLATISIIVGIVNGTYDKELIEE